MHTLILESNINREDKGDVMVILVRTLARNPAAMIGGLLILLVLGMALFAALDESLFELQWSKTLFCSPYQLNIRAKLQPPSSAHPFGTDQLGRDVLARVIFGSKVSVEVGILAVGVSGLLGTLIGLFAAYFGGVLDDVVMRIVDILLAFPGLILAIAVAGFLGPSLINVVFALSIRAWVNYARVVRGEVLRVKEMDYVASAKALGMSHTRIVIRHVLPNVISPVIVQATMGLGGMIVAEAGLSFLGLGPQPPTPSWGNLLSTGRAYITVAWWLSIFPGVAIFLTVMGFNLVGDVLRDVLDPRVVQRQRRERKNT